MPFEYHQVLADRSASRSLNNGRVERTYTQAFLVRAPAANTGQKAVLDALATDLGITFGVHYSTGSESDLYAYCRSINVSVQDPPVWRVTVEYGPYDPTLYTENPLDALPRVRFAFVQFEETVDEDVNGDPVLNSAYDPFDPPVTRDQSRPVIEIQRNEQTYDQTLAAQYKDAVNADDFGPYPPSTVKCSNITAEQLYDPQIQVYYAVSYEFHVNPDGWTKRVLDAGLRQLGTDSSGTAARKQIVIDGVPATAPVPLDGTGKPLAIPVDPSAVVYLEFDVYPSVDFTPAFNFPASVFANTTPLEG